MSQREPSGIDEAALDALFADARRAEPAPLDDALAARLVAGAMVAMPVTRDSTAPRGWWSRVKDILADMGGMPGLAGVGAAGLAGVWIGFSGPGLTDDLVDRFWLGAASMSAPVSALVEGDPLSGAAYDDLLSLMSTSE